jgi:hypothetical protein
MAVTWIDVARDLALRLFVAFFVIGWSPDASALIIFVLALFIFEHGTTTKNTRLQIAGFVIVFSIIVGMGLNLVQKIDGMFDKWDLREDARVFVYRARGSRCDGGELDADLTALELSYSVIVADNRTEAWDVAMAQTRHTAWTIVLAADARVTADFDRIVTREIRRLPIFDVAFLDGSSTTSDRNALFRSARLERVVRSGDVERDCGAGRLVCPRIRALV